MRMIYIIMLLALVACETPTVTTPVGSPKPPAQPVETSIKAIAEQSTCALYRWKDRGRAPAGYIYGMARSYARNLCRYRSSAVTVAGEMGQALQAPQKDALAHYGLNAASGEERLLALYTLGIGLGMRESSGKYCTGRDVSAGSSSMQADTCEAGPFQQSYNSRVASGRLLPLWRDYQAHPERCDLAVWSVGVSPDSNCRTPSAGSGPGRDWQEFTRKCPAFAADWAMVLVRKMKGHFGPLQRKEAEYRPECQAMLKQVTQAIDSSPALCEAL